MRTVERLRLRAEMRKASRLPDSPVPATLRKSRLSPEQLSPAGQPVAMRTEDKFLVPSVFPDGSQVGLYEPKHKTAHQNDLWTIAISSFRCAAEVPAFASSNLAIPTRSA